MTLVPSPASISALSADPIDAFIAPVPPQPDVHFFGITQVGQLYLYGDTPGAPKRLLEPAEGLRFLGVLDCQISQRGPESRYYLDLRLQSMLPNAIFVLSLPCGGTPSRDGSFSTQWSVRSLMGALVEADVAMRATAGILTARRGNTANFIDLYLDSGLPGGELHRVYAEAIGGDRDSLEIAINRVRRALNLEPQFP